MNILVIAPHPDDEVIGCGGTIWKHVQNGNRVSVVFLTSGELGLKQLPRAKAWKIREMEARRAGKILGLAKTYFLRQPDWMVGDHVPAAAAALRPILKSEKPELVYLPHEAEWHPDHQAAWPVLRAACKTRSIPKPNLETYEIWTPLTTYDDVTDISKIMPHKLRALRAHRSQLVEFNYERAIRGLDAFRGMLAARCRYAEVFQTANL